MLLVGTKIRLVRKMENFPFRIGTIFTVENITQNNHITIKNKIGIGIMAYDKLEKYFEIASKNKWTDWTIKYKYSIAFGETSYNKGVDFKYRHNCKTVEIIKDGIKVRAYCHKDDEFDLEKGIEVALAKFEIKKEENKVKKLSLELRFAEEELKEKKEIYKKKYCKDDSMDGEIHKLGTLYVGDMKIKRPTKPWNSSFIPLGASEKGNIYNYNSNSGNIEIRNTDSDDAYKLQWIEVNDNGKKLLICDRNILSRVSWDDLNVQGLVNGKEITIDGQKYKIRLLSGGSNYRSGSDNYSGGSPTDNEWDRIIVNEGNFSELPIPSSTDLDSSFNSTDYSSEHNKVLNWSGMFSWCKEAYSGSSSYRVNRGYYSASSFNSHSSGDRYGFVGWRPVLEVLE